MTWLTNPYRFGGAPAAASYSYWRINFVGNDDGSINGSAFGMSGITLAQTAGGADIAPTATITASSTAAGVGASIAALTDGDPATFWYSFNNNTNLARAEWLKFVFGSAVTLAEIVITPNSTLKEQCPTVFSIEGSDDDVTWICYGIFIAATWTTSSQTFVVPQTPAPIGRANARLWAIDIEDTQVGAAWPAVAELIFAASPGGATLCSGGRGWHQKCLDNPASIGRVAFDGNNATFWQAKPSLPIRLGYAFATAPSAPVEMRLRARPTSPGDTPKQWKIIWSDDGRTWNTTDSLTGQTGWTAGLERSYAIS